MADSAFDSTAAMLLVDQVCDRFERDCRENRAPTLESALDSWKRLYAESAGTGEDPSGERRFTAALLENLIAIDAEYRRRLGQPVELRSYQQQFPDFAEEIARSFALADRTDGAGEGLDSNPSTESASDKADDPANFCRECFRELPPAELSAEGMRECPYCGHLSLSRIAADETTAAAKPLPDLDLPDRFEVRALIGSGAFGVVCRAWDQTLQRSVAIKAPKTQLVDPKLFLREARASSNLRHPNIVRVFDFGETARHVYIVSDLIEGMTLRLWRANPALNYDDACRMMIKIARALQYSHEHGVIHRDLKPGNIVVDHAGEPNILDFGLSHSMRTRRDMIAAAGRPFGTPAFMSPEQVAPSSSVTDARTDVYSMGVMLFQLLTKRLPYWGSSEKIFHDILTIEPRRPREVDPHIPAALDAICLRAMAKNRNDRYPTAAAFADELQRFLDGRRVEAYPRLERRVVVGALRRHWVKLVGAAAVLLAGSSIWLLLQPAKTAGLPLMTVVIDSNPPQAELEWIRYDEQSTELLVDQAARSIAGQPVDLPAGFYKVSARIAGENFEVFRTVPRPNEPPLVGMPGLVFPHTYFEPQPDGTIKLPDIAIVAVADLGRDLVEIKGGTVSIPNDPQFAAIFAGKSADVGDFWIDRREVTLGDLRAAFPQYSHLPNEADDVPAHSIPQDVAVAYAEKVGMNLPTYWEFVWAATNRGATRHSWGNGQPEQTPAEILANPALFADQTPGDQPIQNLLLGRAEWTETPRPGLLFPPQAPGSSPNYIPGSIHEFMAYGFAPSRNSSNPESDIWPPSTTPGGFFLRSSEIGTVGFRCLRRKVD